MRLAGRLKLGFYPLPAVEAERIRAHLSFSPATEFSAVDPCVGDGVALSQLLQGTQGRAYGIEIDSFRAEQAGQIGIEVLHANTFSVRCPAASISLLYLNPPYDHASGERGNQRLEKLFLEHCFPWLKAKGVLIFVLQRGELRGCARLLAENFSDLRVFRLTEPECMHYRQVVVLASRRSRREHLSDEALTSALVPLSDLVAHDQLPSLHRPDMADFRYPVPDSRPVKLTSQAIPLDEVEDLLPRSAAYRQAVRVLIHQPCRLQERPLTPLHGGHVSLLATAGMLNGVFGEGDDRHIAHWRSVKVSDQWEEAGENGIILKHERESFSHELSLVFRNGRIQVLTHQKQEEEP